MTSFMPTTSSPDTQTDYVSANNGYGYGYSTFLLSLQHLYFIELVVNIFIIPLLSLFGIFANVANIIVFGKLGFLEATNIMFLALSVADLFILLSYIIGTCAVNTLFDDFNTTFYNLDDLLMIVNPFLWAFLGFSSCTTALIAVERSVCVLLPLKVKTIFTPKRTGIAVLCLFFLPVATLIQKYVIMELEWITNPLTNQTLLALVYTEDKLVMDFVTALMYSTIPSLLSFIVVVVGTTLMVVRLNQSARWRKAASQSTEKKAVSAKEVKVVRSVVLVCSVFIVCFTPNAVISVAAAVYPKLHMTNWYFGPFVYAMYSFTNLFQAISSSMNIWIYLGTSTRFRETFVRIFFFKKKS